MAFHPGGERWATSGFDGKLKLWDLSGTDLGTVGLPDDERKLGIRIAGLAFSPDGEYVAAVVQRRVRVWPVAAFKEPEVHPPVRLPLIEGARHCAALAYSPDGRWLAVGCSDAGVRLFEMPAGTLVKTITVHKNEVPSMSPRSPSRRCTRPRGACRRRRRPSASGRRVAVQGARLAPA